MGSLHKNYMRITSISGQLRPGSLGTQTGEMKMKTFKSVVQLIFALSIASLGALVGAAHGWTYHGMLGAIVLGTIGFGVGAALGSNPILLLQVFH
jgi:hypothetical protein